MTKPFKKAFLPLLLFITVLLQGCIEIVEEVTVRNDRSGSISLSVEVGRGNSLLGIFGEFTDLSFPDELVDMAGYYSRELRKQEGISNVQLVNKSRSGQLSLSFDFEDQCKLNRALYAMAGVQKTIFNPNIYKIKNKKVERRNVTKLVKLIIEDAQEEEAGEILYEFISFRSVFSTPRDTRKVKTNMPVKISQNKRVVTTKIELTELYENNASTRLRVRY